MVLIELRGVQFNRKINLLRGLGRFNRGLALIGFRTTGAWRAFLKRPENFSCPETVPQSSRNDFRVFLKAPEKF